MFNLSRGLKFLQAGRRQIKETKREVARQKEAIQRYGDKLVLIDDFLLSAAIPASQGGNSLFFSLLFGKNARRIDRQIAKGIKSQKIPVSNILLKDIEGNIRDILDGPIASFSQKSAEEVQNDTSRVGRVQQALVLHQTVAQNLLQNIGASETEAIAKVIESKINNTEVLRAVPLFSVLKAIDSCGVVSGAKEYEALAPVLGEGWQAAIFYRNIYDLHDYSGREVKPAFEPRVLSA